MPTPSPDSLPAENCRRKPIEVRRGDRLLYVSQGRAHFGKVTLIHDGFAQVRQPSGGFVAVLPTEIISKLSD